MLEEGEIDEDEMVGGENSINNILQVDNKIENENLIKKENIKSEIKQIKL